MQAYVTGIGPVSSIGIGHQNFAASLFEGKVGTSQIRSFDTSGFPTDQAGEVHDFDSESLCRNANSRDFGRSALFAAAAGRLAVDDAELSDAELFDRRVAICMGTTSGESQEIEAATVQYHRDTPGKIALTTAQKAPAQRLGEAVERELGVPLTRNYTFSTACSASNYSLVVGSLLIQQGLADVAIVGGADSVCRWAHAGFFRLGAMSHDVCRPFDAERQGMLTAEGGVALVLESERSIISRQGQALAKVLGGAINCDANHMVAPNRASIARCMQLALERAAIRPNDVDYISAHGTGTQANDRTESSAIYDVFGPAAPPVSSIKSMLGHTMGAASGFGAAACVLSLIHQLLPPTANFRIKGSDIPIPDIVSVPARRARVRVAQNHGFAFGGNNAIAIFGEAS